MRSLEDIIPSAATREFIEIIHRANPDPRVGAWLAWGLSQGEWIDAGESHLALEVARRAAAKPADSAKRQPEAVVKVQKQGVLL